MNYKLGKDIVISWRLAIKSGIDYTKAKYELYSPNGTKVNFDSTVTKIKEVDGYNIIEIKGTLFGDKQVAGTYYLKVFDTIGVQLDAVSAFELVSSLDEAVYYGKNVRDVRTIDVDVEDAVINADYIKDEINKSVGDTIKYELVDDLPTSGEVGTIYLLRSEKSEDDKYSEYIYYEGEWEKFGNGELSLDGYYDKDEVDGLLNNKLNTSAYTEYDDTEIRGLIANKQDAGDYALSSEIPTDFYSKSEVDSKLLDKVDNTSWSSSVAHGIVQADITNWNGKANASDVYTKNDIDTAGFAYTVMLNDYYDKSDVYSKTEIDSQIGNIETILDNIIGG